MALSADELRGAPSCSRCEAPTDTYFATAYNSSSGLAWDHLRAVPHLDPATGSECIGSDVLVQPHPQSPLGRYYRWLGRTHRHT